MSSKKHSDNPKSYLFTSEHTRSLGSATCHIDRKIMFSYALQNHIWNMNEQTRAQLNTPNWISHFKFGYNVNNSAKCQRALIDSPDELIAASDYISCENKVWNRLIVTWDRWLCRYSCRDRKLRRSMLDHWHTRFNKLHSHRRLRNAL